MIILIKGILKTLDYFIDAMAKGHEDAVVLDINNPEETLLPIIEKIDKTTFVVTFNNVGVNFNIWKNRGVTIYNFLVDHPAFYIGMITRDYYPGYNVICIDRLQVDYLRELFPQIKDSFIFVPHGGVAKCGINTDKDIDVLYAGSFFKDDDINFPLLPFKHDSEQFYQFMFDYYEKDSTKEPQDAVKAYAAAYGYSFKTEEYVVLVDYTLKTVAFAFQAIRRKQLIEHLAMAGMNISICGNDAWREIASKYPNNITYCGKITPDECIDMIGRSKVLINDHPNFADGSHERVFNGMLNGTVVLSNYSEYLGERFTDGEEILFWDGMNYDEAVAKVSEVLKDDYKREQMVRNAYEKVQNDTWSDRLSEIDSIFMGRK